MTVAAGPTRRALVAELTEVVGSPHEARFIVDEALGLGLDLGHPNVPSGPLDEEALTAARRGWCAVRLRRWAECRISHRRRDARRAGRIVGHRR